METEIVLQINGIFLFFHSIIANPFLQKKRTTKTLHPRQNDAASDTKNSKGCISCRSLVEFFHF